MSQTPYQVVIIGAGVAGLRCAQVLQQKGIKTLILEQHSTPGGKVRTRQQNGFLLDEGFQVLNDSYEELHLAVSFKELGTRSFDSGAMVARGNGNLKFAFHPLRHPDRIFSTILQYPGSISDMWKMGKLALKNRKANPDFWKNIGNINTADFIESQNFSQTFYNGFIRPFFGGVFLDPGLGLPLEYFEWLLAKFYSGRACLPKHGMAGLPSLMAATAGEIRFQTKVLEIREGVLILENGEMIEADWIVDARSFQDKGQAGNFRSTTTLYLEGPAQAVLPKSLVLNENPDSPILHFCFPSAIQPGYAPEGRSLCSLTLHKHLPSEENPMAILLPQLQTLFPQVNWKAFSLLAIVDIPFALPAFPENNSMSFRVEGRKIAIGDHCLYPSLNGALRSGRESAEWLSEKAGLRSVTL
jgi:hypothetical protein